MKKILGFGLVLLFLAAFAGTLYYLYEKSQRPTVQFATETPFSADIFEKTVATGSVMPRREVEIKPQISGIIEELFVEAGDVVKRGDLVARIRVVPDTLSLNEAENRLARSR
ncbi:MAG: biotin/lipoyl-binding protein, partial [Acidobacteriota bacterium]